MSDSFRPTRSSSPAPSKLLLPDSPIPTTLPPLSSSSSSSSRSEVSSLHYPEGLRGSQMMHFGGNGRISAPARESESSSLAQVSKDFIRHICSDIFSGAYVTYIRRRFWGATFLRPVPIPGEIFGTSCTADNTLTFNLACLRFDEPITASERSVSYLLSLFNAYAI